MPMLLRGDFGYTMLADPISKALDPAFFCRLQPATRRVLNKNPHKGLPGEYGGSPQTMAV